MNEPQARSVPCARTALALGPWAGAADYWAYTYKDLDVMAEGTCAEAQSRQARQVGGWMRPCARSCACRGRERAAHARVCSVPQSELTALDAVWSAEGGAFFRAGPFDDYLVLRRTERQGASDIVHAERAHALLASWGMARLARVVSGTESRCSWPAASFDQDR